MPAYMKPSQKFQVSSNSDSDSHESMRRRKFSKHTWTTEEDTILEEAIEKYGEKSWTKIASLLKGRVGKQCRDRWCNHLRPAVKKGNWTKEEDNLLFEAHRKYGNQWAEIARQILPGRTDLSVKNRYYSTLRRADRKQARAERVRERDSTKRKRNKESDSDSSDLSEDEIETADRTSSSVPNKKLRTFSPTNSPTNRFSSLNTNRKKIDNNSENASTVVNTVVKGEQVKSESAGEKQTGTSLGDSLNLAQLIQQQQNLASVLSGNWATGSLPGSFSSINGNLLSQQSPSTSQADSHEGSESKNDDNTNKKSQAADLSTNVAMALFQLQNNLNPQLFALQSLVQQSNQIQLAAALQQQGNLENKLNQTSNNSNNTSQTPIPRAYANGRAVSGAYPGTENTGRWSHEEHSKFLEGMNMFGNKNWTCIADVVKTRTVVQVRTHAQKYFKKLRKQKLEKGISGDLPEEEETKSASASEMSVDVDASNYIGQNINSVSAASMLLALQQA